jgi:hypothetical protein
VVFCARARLYSLRKNSCFVLYDPTKSCALIQNQNSADRSGELGAPLKPPFGLSGPSGSRSVASHLPRPPKKNDSVEGYQPPSPASGPRTLPLLRIFHLACGRGEREVADREPFIPLKPKDGLNGAPSICCRCGEKLWRGSFDLLHGSADSHADSKALMSPLFMARLKAGPHTKHRYSANSRGAVAFGRFM